VLADRGVPAPARPVDPGRAGVAGRAGAPTGAAGGRGRLLWVDRHAGHPIGRLERQIGKLAKPDPRVAALMALPGIGRLTAMTLLAEIGGIGGFPSARKLCAWAGLTPAVRNLRPQGPPWASHQAGLAVGAVGGAGGRAAGRTSPPFVGVSAQIAHRRGQQIATVAVARRLGGRSLAHLKQLQAAPQLQTTPESEKVKTGRARVYA
jgi:Transposase IS116/IS110/IS902 family